MTISVVICSCNRCESLKDTLNSLLSQECDDSFDYEIILVDNNSKDKTKEVVESYMAKFNGKLRYILESSQGLSYARNKGVKESKGEFIAFTDDDVIVDERWLLSILECFKQYNSYAIGGRILPLYTDKTPLWIKKNQQLLEGPVVSYDYGKNISSYAERHMLPIVGANMAFKRECFNEFGLFRTDLGAGSLGMTGDDTDFFKRIAAKNKENMYYCGTALIFHKIDNSRANFRYVANWWINSGRSCVYRDCGKIEDGIVSYFGVPRYVIRDALVSALYLIFSLFNQKKVLKKSDIFFRKIGMIFEYRRMHKRKKYQCIK